MIDVEVRYGELYVPELKPGKYLVAPEPASVSAEVFCNRAKFPDTETTPLRNLQKRRFLSSDPPDHRSGKFAEDLTPVAEDIPRSFTVFKGRDGRKYRYKRPEGISVASKEDVRCLKEFLEFIGASEDQIRYLYRFFEQDFTEYFTKDIQSNCFEKYNDILGDGKSAAAQNESNALLVLTANYYKNKKSTLLFDFSEPNKVIVDTRTAYLDPDNSVYGVTTAELEIREAGTYTKNLGASESILTVLDPETIPTTEEGQRKLFADAKRDPAYHRVVRVYRERLPVEENIEPVKLATHVSVLFESDIAEVLRAQRQQPHKVVESEVIEESYIPNVVAAEPEMLSPEEFCRELGIQSDMREPLLDRHGQPLPIQEPTLQQLYAQNFLSSYENEERNASQLAKDLERAAYVFIGKDGKSYVYNGPVGAGGTKELEKFLRSPPIEASESQCENLFKYYSQTFGDPLSLRINLLTTTLAVSESLTPEQQEFLNTEIRGNYLSFGGSEKHNVYRNCIIDFSNSEKITVDSRAYAARKNDSPYYVTASRTEINGEGSRLVSLGASPFVQACLNPDTVPKNQAKLDALLAKERQANGLAAEKYQKSVRESERKEEPKKRYPTIDFVSVPNFDGIRLPNMRESRGEARLRSEYPQSGSQLFFADFKSGKLKIKTQDELLDWQSFVDWANSPGSNLNRIDDKALFQFLGTKNISLEKLASIDQHYCRIDDDIRDRRFDTYSILVCDFSNPDGAVTLQSKSRILVQGEISRQRVQRDLPGIIVRNYTLGDPIRETTVGYSNPLLENIATNKEIPTTFSKLLEEADKFTFGVLYVPDYTPGKAVVVPKPVTVSPETFCLRANPSEHSELGKLRRKFFLDNTPPGKSKELPTTLEQVAKDTDRTNILFRGKDGKYYQYVRGNLTASSPENIIQLKKFVKSIGASPKQIENLSKFFRQSFAEVFSFSIKQACYAAYEAEKARDPEQAEELLKQLRSKFWNPESIRGNLLIDFSEDDKVLVQSRTAYYAPNGEVYGVTTANLEITDVGTQMTGSGATESICTLLNQETSLTTEAKQNAIFALESPSEAAANKRTSEAYDTYLSQEGIDPEDRSESLVFPFIVFEEDILEVSEVQQPQVKQTGLSLFLADFKSNELKISIREGEVAWQNVVDWFYLYPTAGQNDFNSLTEAEQIEQLNKFLAQKEISIDQIQGIYNDYFRNYFSNVLHVDESYLPNTFAEIADLVRKAEFVEKKERIVIGPDLLVFSQSLNRTTINFKTQANEKITSRENISYIRRAKGENCISPVETKNNGKASLDYIYMEFCTDRSGAGSQNKLINGVGHTEFEAFIKSNNYARSCELYTTEPSCPDIEKEKQCYVWLRSLGLTELQCVQLGYSYHQDLNGLMATSLTDSTMKSSPLPWMGSFEKSSLRLELINGELYFLNICSQFSFTSPSPLQIPGSIISRGLLTPEGFKITSVQSSNSLLARMSTESGTFYQITDEQIEAAKKEEAEKTYSPQQTFEPGLQQIIDWYLKPLGALNDIPLLKNQIDTINFAILNPENISIDSLIALREQLEIAEKFYFVMPQERRLIQQNEQYSRCFWAKNCLDAFVNALLTNPALAADENLKKLSPWAWLNRHPDKVPSALKDKQLMRQLNESQFEQFQSTLIPSLGLQKEKTIRLISRIARIEIAKKAYEKITDPIHRILINEALLDIRKQEIKDAADRVRTSLEQFAYPDLADLVILKKYLLEIKPLRNAQSNEIPNNVKIHSHFDRMVKAIYASTDPVIINEYRTGETSVAQLKFLSPAIYIANTDNDAEETVKIVAEAVKRKALSSNNILDFIDRHKFSLQVHDVCREVASLSGPVNPSIKAGFGIQELLTRLDFAKQPAPRGILTKIFGRSQGNEFKYNSNSTQQEAIRTGLFSDTIATLSKLNGAEKATLINSNLKFTLRTYRLDVLQSIYNGDGKDTRFEFIKSTKLWNSLVKADQQKFTRDWNRREVQQLFGLDKEIATTLMTENVEIALFFMKNKKAREQIGLTNKDFQSLYATHQDNQEFCDLLALEKLGTKAQKARITTNLFGQIKSLAVDAQIPPHQISNLIRYKLFGQLSKEAPNKIITSCDHQTLAMLFEALAKGNGRVITGKVISVVQNAISLQGTINAEPAEIAKSAECHLAAAIRNNHTVASSVADYLENQFYAASDNVEKTKLLNSLVDLACIERTGKFAESILETGFFRALRGKHVSSHLKASHLSRLLNAHPNNEKVFNIITTKHNIFGGRSYCDLIKPSDYIELLSQKAVFALQQKIEMRSGGSELSEAYSRNSALLQGKMSGRSIRDEKVSYLDFFDAYLLYNAVQEDIFQSLKIQTYRYGTGEERPIVTLEVLKNLAAKLPFNKSDDMRSLFIHKAKSNFDLLDLIAKNQLFPIEKLSAMLSDHDLSPLVQLNYPITDSEAKRLMEFWVKTGNKIPRALIISGTPFERIASKAEVGMVKQPELKNASEQTEEEVEIPAFSAKKQAEAERLKQAEAERLKKDKVSSPKGGSGVPGSSARIHALLPPIEPQLRKSEAVKWHEKFCDASTSNAEANQMWNDSENRNKMLLALGKVGNSLAGIIYKIDTLENNKELITQLTIEQLKLVFGSTSAEHFEALCDNAAILAYFVHCQDPDSVKSFQAFTPEIVSETENEKITSAWEKLKKNITDANLKEGIVNKTVEQANFEFDKRAGDIPATTGKMKTPYE